MPVSYSDIGLQEPSTITNRVAAVTVVRNSTAMQQELLTLADPQTSNALARITDTTPDSTMFGVVVREAVPQSTTVNVSSVAGTVTVTPAAGSTFTVRAMQSSAADLNVTVAGYSTTVNVSSVGGRVLVAPSDTNWASSAGFHLNSSGELLVKDAGNSTTVSVANTVSVQPAAGSTWTVHLGAEHQSTAVAPSNSSALNVRVVGGVSSAADFKVYDMPASTQWASSAGFHFDSSGGLQVNAGTIATSTTVNVSSLAGLVLVAMQDSSNTLVNPGDATNKAIRVNVVAGASVSSTEFVVRQSTAADFQVTATIGLNLQSTAQVNSNSSALNVRVVGGVSSAVDFKGEAWLADGLGNDIESSTRASGNSSLRGLAVRSVTPDSTFVAGQAASSGDTSLISSVAGQSIYVYAVGLNWGGVLTTNTNQLVRLQSGSTGTELFRWRFIVSNIGATTQPLSLAVTPPAYLFRTAAAANLSMSATSSGAIYNIAAWRE